ncbi:hypothetical protein [Pseudolysinimonas sp.]
MPYETGANTFEKAGRLSHAQAAARAVAEKRDFHVPAETISDSAWLDGRIYKRADLEAATPATPLALAIAVDGSHVAEAIRDGMPSVLYGFAQAAAATVDLEAMAQQRTVRFTDPVALAAAVQTALVSVDLPISGAYARPGVDITTSWRELIFEQFGSRRVELEKLRLTLLELLMRLHGTADIPSTTLPVNCVDCDRVDVPVPASGIDCPGCGTALYPTDTLRIHESVTEDGGNIEALGRLRSVIELLVLVGIATLFWVHDRALLSRTLLIVDGPLAMYGEPAKLRSWASSFFQDMTARMPGPGPFVCGVEKSGSMVDFASRLADLNLIAPGELIACDTEVLRRIVNSANPDAYGKETYWGRKFIYRSTDGRVVVLTVPPDDGSAYDSNSGQPGPAGYGTLTTVLAVVDRTGSSMYRNGIIPVAAAHGKAAFPIGVGTDVLHLVSQQVLGLGA